jgi:hypothetical protein
VLNHRDSFALDLPHSRINASIVVPKVVLLLLYTSSIAVAANMQNVLRKTFLLHSRFAANSLSSVLKWKMPFFSKYDS